MRDIAASLIENLGKKVDARDLVGVGMFKQIPMKVLEKEARFKVGGGTEQEYKDKAVYFLNRKRAEAETPTSE